MLTRRLCSLACLVALFTGGCDNFAAKQKAVDKAAEEQKAKAEQERAESEKRLKDEKREKAIECYNNWNHAHNEWVTNWNQYVKVQNTGSKERRLEYLSKCRAAILRIEPIRPTGVDGGLAAAVSDHKLAALTFTDFMIDSQSRWIKDSKNADTLNQRMDAAAAKVSLEFNRISAEVGGIELEEK